MPSFTDESVELIQATQKEAKEFFSGKGISVEFKEGGCLHLRFKDGFCYIGLSGCCCGETFMERGKEISVGPMGMNILERPDKQLRSAFGAIVTVYLPQAAQMFLFSSTDTPS